MPEKLRIVREHDTPWVRIELDGDTFYEGHSIPDSVWLDILRKSARYLNVVEIEVSEAWFERN